MYFNFFPLSHHDVECFIEFFFPFFHQKFNICGFIYVLFLFPLTDGRKYYILKGIKCALIKIPPPANTPSTKIILIPHNSEIRPFSFYFGSKMGVLQQNTIFCCLLEVEGFSKETLKILKHLSFIGLFFFLSFVCHVSHYTA